MPTRPRDPEVQAPATSPCRSGLVPFEHDCRAEARGRGGGMKMRHGFWTAIALVLTSFCQGEEVPPPEMKGFVAEQFARKIIYHSPQTPGYTCWVGAWVMPDRSLMVAFSQATGPLKDRPR